MYFSVGTCVWYTMADLPVQLEVVVGESESSTPVSTASANFVVGGGCEGGGLTPTSVGKGRSLGVRGSTKVPPSFRPIPRGSERCGLRR